MSETTPAADADTIIHLELKTGRVVIKLRPDLAPQHVERFRTLAAEGFYDNIAFHRVIDGFMAQSGDPTGTGSGGSKLPDLKSEFTNKAKFVRGTLGAARTGNPHSANSQFFIMFAPAPSLDGQYSIFGEVTEGMELVDQIKRGAGGSGVVSDPDRIVSMRPASQTAT
ncbi:peptidylprolyl isomerase [Lichenicola cladoniae]|uniref:Peptidyl-prolyl cis-trans isomerase n=1 Tax=Lichenicola cladoniae TaxID=1484109 RepID=A0A6M8HQ03_9PROT|nr:peptidylprolyl isomerase [Lichenicola cladoniae]NPD66389.1 peptidylprolyl isomerase [Acetobacteraceae bacterium]QKE90370.1 peptidylprolyl isomerase [Lichenicola cladoniae]